MEFHEKLQELRKNRGLTQEELAAALFVSRTAVSKWESGRGYPSIDSLKDLSGFFSVTIDDLLSGDKLISIAKEENRSNLQRLCDILIGLADILYFSLILLPLYPNIINDHIYPVNLFDYANAAPLHLMVYWFLFVSLIAAGAAKILLTKLRIERFKNAITVFSMLLSIFTVFFLAMGREAYAIVTAFALLIIKAALFFFRNGNYFS